MDEPISNFTSLLFPWILAPSFPKKVTSRLCSNYLAHLYAIDLGFYRAVANGEEWVWVFEDDIAITPGLSPTQVNEAVTEVMATQKSRSIVYLGGCFPNSPQQSISFPFNFPVSGGSVAVGNACCFCVHAYGYPVSYLRTFMSNSSSLADALFKFNTCTGPPKPYDVVLYEKCADIRNTVVIVGFNFGSPVVSGHVGLFYQARNLYQSMIPEG